MPFAIAPDGIHLYYEVTGRGEPILLVAGRASDHHLWNLIRPDFEQHQVIVYDQRGTGQSDKPEAPPYSTAGFAGDAIAILDHMGVARAHVYGVSMGGAIGQLLGIEHAQRVGALVLACSSPGGAHRFPPTEAAQTLISGSSGPNVMEAFFAHQWATPRFFLSMRESLKHPMPEYAEQLHAQANLEHDSWERLPEISAATLILQGNDDPVVPPANARLLQERIPGAALHLVRRGRHMFFIEFSREVDRLVNNFLARHALHEKD